ncbi:MAG TPA: glycosyltransferase [Bryobacteraceae bacterium]|nr:glycosyltransferase [Bryobacteraceae bacterium]
MSSDGRPRPILLMVRKLDIGGCERDLTKIATGLDRSRFEPHVGCFQAQGLRAGELQAAAIPIVELPVRSIVSTGGLRGAWEMIRYIHRNRIELVHAFDVPTDMFGVPVARAAGTRVVISSQLSYRHLYSEKERHLLRITDRMVDKILVNCRAVRKHLIEDERVDPERIYLSYNGVDTAIFHPRATERPVEVKGAALVIGTVANLRVEKGLDLLIEAFAKLGDLRRGMKLAIVGHGPLEAELKAQARELGIEDACIFEPGRPDVADWMRSIDIFVSPSRSESFSNSLLEAMASGCMVVGSAVGGTPELITDGRTGLLFRVGDVADLTRALGTAIRDETTRERLARAAASFASENLGVEKAVERAHELYGTLLA